jgi:tetratricopeptide (TPR) repeat protein
MGLFDFLKKKPGDPHVAGPVPNPGTPSPVPPPTPASTPEAAAPVPAGPTPAAKPPAAAAPAGGKPPAKAEAKATAAGPEFVEASDAFGRRVKLSRAEYRDRVLPELLKAHGSDPDRLAAVILQGVRDGLASEMIAAANRLTVIDKDLDRALSILGVVQRDAGDLDAAEFTMQELQQKRPQSANARVGLAMLADKRGDAARCEAVLWEALQLDCNHADAVHCYLQVRHRAVGDDGYRAEIDKIVALPGSWRAQLWRARLDLQQEREAEAVAAYRDVLARAGDEVDALVMASADLVQAGRHELVDELVVPRFQPGRHHPNIGLALLHHYLATERHDPGAELLHQMHLHYGHMLGDQLQPFTAAFDRLRLSKLPAPAPLPANARIGLVRLDRPIWCAGLHDPQWLLPKKETGGKQVMFLSLAIEGQPQLPAGREDEVGRLTRGVPLLLAEHAWLSTPHRGTAGLPMAEQSGWALMGRPWNEEQLASQLGDEERKHTILVTGVLRVDGEQRRIDLWAYDCAARQRIGHAAAEGPVAEVGRMLLQLIAELWPALGGPAGHKPPVGDEAFWLRYTDGLAQHAALVAAQAGGMPKERLYGERYVVQWLQQAALSESRWQPGFWLYASGLCVLRQLGSKVPLEHARAVAEIFRQSAANTAFARLAVCPLRAVGLDAVWQSRRPEIVAAAAGDTNYLAWLQRAEAAQ